MNQTQEVKEVEEDTGSENEANAEDEEDKTKKKKKKTGVFKEGTKKFLKFINSKKKII